MKLTSQVIAAIDGLFNTLNTIGINKVVVEKDRIRAISDNNKRIADERKAFEEAQKKTVAALVELEKTNKARWARIKELERLAIPPVDISGMTQEQIVVEITDCRQAVEINNGF
jgi:hypothetical protein